jgi:hypothetical protein
MIIFAASVRNGRGQIVGCEMALKGEIYMVVFGGKLVFNSYDYGQAERNYLAWVNGTVD